MGKAEVYCPSIPIDKRQSDASQVPEITPDSRADVVEQQRNAERLEKAIAPIVEITPARIDELRQIADEFPGAHRHVDRVEHVLRRGPLNSVEALFVGSMHVNARILGLRERGFEIASRWVRVRGFDDELHRVHEWRLVAAPAAGEVIG